MVQMLEKLFDQIPTGSVELSKKEIAELLNTSPEALHRFEETYNKIHYVSDNLAAMNAEDTIRGTRKESRKDMDNIADRIVNELLAITPVWEFDGKTIRVTDKSLTCQTLPVTMEEIEQFAPEDRPQLTSVLMRREINGDTSAALLYNFKKYLELKGTDKKKAEQFYHMFRQGLDILDLDPLTYSILGKNPNSMGCWLPEIAGPVVEQGFFRIPETTIIKVPLTMLQLTRLDYERLTQTTKNIVNRFCEKVFRLDRSKDYFIKTGTYSSKFDFRNAHVIPSEVKELGEYLLFIQHQATMMAAPLSSPSIYGVSTTNEWVVREFIKDREDNGCIYHGLPLHTEYRLFVDFDTCEVLDIREYWDKDTMLRRFINSSDSDTPDMKHDAVSFIRMADRMAVRFHENKDEVCRKIREILPKCRLSGQWSLDVMQNRNDFWIIDMALAYQSALNDRIKDRLEEPDERYWLPGLV